MQLSVADVAIPLSPFELVRESAVVVSSATSPEFKFTTLTTCADMKSGMRVGIADALVIGWQNR